MFAAGKTAAVSGAGPDAQFNYVTMLLHGDGTNGAQNNTFLDNSTNNFTITRNGNTTQGSFSPYGSNWSNYFDGTGDYLTVPDNSAWAFGSGNFTLEAWVYRTVSGATQMIVIQSDNATAAGSAWSFYILSTNKLVANVYYGSSFITLTSSADVPSNAWVHVALVRTSGTVSQYINGSRDGTSASLSTNSLNDVAQTVGIGATNAGNERLTGYLSNLRIIKGAGPYDATSSTLTVPTAALTAITNTQLLTCADNRFIDDSANNFTITRNGDTSVQRFNPFGTATAYSTSVIGGSGYFDGSGDSLNATSNAAFQFGTGDFTIEAWVYSTNLTGTNAIFDSRTGVSEANGVMFYIRADGMLVMYRNTASVTASTALLQNSWNHCALTRSGSTCTLWLNGVSVGTATDSTNLSQQNSSIGSAYTGSNNLMLGYISNLRVVKGTAVYTTTFTPPTAPLTAITNTSLLTNFTNGAIFDNAMMNDLETVGNAQISTSVKKYGTGSLSFDGTGDYLKQSNNPLLQNFQLHTGDFTIEAWIYKVANGSAGYDNLFQLGTNGNATDGWFIEISSLRGYVFYTNSTNIITHNVNPNTSAWQHFAVCRSGNNTKMFVNGSQIGSTYTSSYTVPSTATQATLGVDGSQTLFFNGYVDDFRITKGFARYTTTFTPPTAALSDTGPI